VIENFKYYKEKKGEKQTEGRLLPSLVFLYVTFFTEELFVHLFDILSVARYNILLLFLGKERGGFYVYNY